ncbi:MAG: hypothetical protein J0H51_20445 [Rhizobiales bacterium]|nr:hypothetical protein [Hyphomicrobiales bacterium]
MKRRGLALGLLVAGAALLNLRSVATAQSPGAFSGMAGVWSGSGTVSLDNGQSERIRCRATYAVSSDGTGLNQTLTCASDSYKFDLKSNVIAQGGVLSGTWNESSRNVGGNLKGKAHSGHFDVVVSAPSFTANLSMTTTGNKQRVSIRSEGAFKSASISLSRS